MKLIGVDVGGTFTDLVFVDTLIKSVVTHKVPTTPGDPSEGVLQGMLTLCDLADVRPGTIDRVLHGTTTATNAVLEYDGVAAGLITNSGYRDILHIGRHQRPQHYSIMQDVPWQDRPLIRRRHRKTVGGRIVPPTGAELTPLDEEGVRMAARELRDEGIMSIAVCFLFSYLDPSHENRARDIVLAEHADCFVTTSSAVAPQFREFERFTTTAMNAFIGPKVRTYVARLQENLASCGFSAALHVMGSNGGIATAKMVSEKPVITLLSGPAAGVIGGAWAGSLAGRKNLITFDVGGTSADIGIVREGLFEEASARDTSIAGYPVLIPMIDIHTVGAGGGSIAYLDDGGAFRVGPRSAGARPGPAAYGHGGDKPTVTDANVVLGRLNAENFLGGAMTLDKASAERVVGDFAATIGLPLFETAEGILKIANANMANLIRSRTVQKGLDPREFSLVAFGGGGPLQAIDVAAELGIPEVVVPPAPGITSAIGLVTTDMKYDAVRTAFLISTHVDAKTLQTVLDAMRSDMANQMTADGLAVEECRFEHSADLRYVGQGYELRIPVPARMTKDDLPSLWQRFSDRHSDEYGHHHPEDPIEIVNLRVTGVGTTPKLDVPRMTVAGSLAEALVGESHCFFRLANGLRSHSTPLYRRDLLPIDKIIHGPALIVQKDTTSILRPRDTAVADDIGNLIITLGAEV
jgi:N-methylhydantoinase A